MADARDRGRVMPRRDRENYPSPETFRALLAAKAIRPASLEDVYGTHHQRPLYAHPHTHEWFVATKDVALMPRFYQVTKVDLYRQRRKRRITRLLSDAIWKQCGGGLHVASTEPDDPDASSPDTELVVDGLLDVSALAEAIVDEFEDDG